MWSASSSTVISTRLRSAAPCSIRSIRRPGVATTMSTPRSKARSWGCIGHAAGDQDERQPGGSGERSQHVADLLSQLAGRGEDDRPRAAARGAGEGGEERQAEGQGLARARPGPAEHVPARQRIGDRGRLDREGCRDPRFAELVDQGRRQPQRLEVAGDRPRGLGSVDHGGGSTVRDWPPRRRGLWPRSARSAGDHRFLGVPSALEDLGCMALLLTSRPSLDGPGSGAPAADRKWWGERRTSLRPQSCWRSWPDRRSAAGRVEST